MLAEDDDDFRNLLVLALERDGYRVASVASGAALLDALRSIPGHVEPPALIVTDYRMPRGTGLEVLVEVRRWGWNVPMVLITAFGDEDTALQAQLAGATVMRKPFDLDDFRTLAAYLVPPRESAGPLVCAACGSVDDLRWIDETSDVFFCRDCRELAENLDLEDGFLDLGEGD